jgi:hypothetical protein
MRMAQQLILFYDAMRHSTYEYACVGGVHVLCLQEELSKFLGDAIINVGAAVSSQGRPVTFCRVQRDKNFAFVEVRSAEEASNVMALDGLVFKDVPLKVCRKLFSTAIVLFCQMQDLLSVGGKGLAEC